MFYSIDHRPISFRNLAGATAIAVAAGLFMTSPQVHAETVDIPVPHAVVSTAINSVITSIAVTVDNYGRKHMDGKTLSWHENTGHVHFPGVSPRRINIPEQGVRISHRKLRGYVNDMNLQNIKATVLSNGRIRVDGFFESQGREIVVKCVRYVVLKRKWNKECIIKKSLLVGSGGNINNARFSVILRPVVRNGGISYAKNVSVDFRADMKLGGACGKFDKLCSKLTRYKSLLRNAVVAGLERGFSSNSMRQRIAAATSKELRKLDVLKQGWTLKGLRSSGSRYILTIERPDQIDGKSVRIVGFKPKTKNIVHSCPVNVGFDATIRSKYRLKGSAYLVYENGKKGKVFKWSMPKNGKATSTIVRKFKGAAGKAYKNRHARLVVKWKNQKGKLFKQVSKKAVFKVSCLKTGGGLALSN